IGIAVVAVVVDAQRGAILQDHARRALDLDRQRLERIPEPADLELLTVEHAFLDRGTVVIGNDLVLLVAAPDQGALVREVGAARLVTDGLEIARTPVERNMKFRIGKTRAFDDRLEIAGEESLLLAQPRNAHRPEIVLEEGARRRRVGRLHAGGAAADLPQA